jgi:hypothetical protein
MAVNKNLSSAKKAKKDEFYTQLSDIENELRNYKRHFKDKTVFCNCDDPYESNFFKYFAMNFNQLGLKKLIATCFAGSIVAERQLTLFDEEENQTKTSVPHKIVITEVTDLNGDGATNLADVEWLIKNDKNVLTRLKGNGDFRSEECIELLKEADIVVTNPPFSLFREYLSQLIEFDKKFVIIGNKNALTYKEVFKLIKDNNLWIGCTPTSKEMYFDTPQSYIDEAIANNKNRTAVMVRGKYMCRAQAIWLTNLDHKKRHDMLDLYKHYSPEEYPKYDNYDAINVDVTAEIPMDYDGMMGVPISFLDKYNPEQFEILGITQRNDDPFKTKKYTTDEYRNANDLNARGVIIVNGVPKSIYTRILIRKKQ